MQVLPTQEHRSVVQSQRPNNRVAKNRNSKKRRWKWEKKLSRVKVMLVLALGTT